VRVFCAPQRLVHSAFLYVPWITTISIESISDDEQPQRKANCGYLFATNLRATAQDVSAGLAGMAVEGCYGGELRNQFQTFGQGDFPEGVVGSGERKPAAQG